MSCRDGFCFSIFSIHNKNNSWTPLASVGAAGRVCTNTSGDAGMKKASTRLLEQETQTPSPAPDLIPAESSTENLHWDWYSKRGHFSLVCESPARTPFPHDGATSTAARYTWGSAASV